MSDLLLNFENYFFNTITKSFKQMLKFNLLAVVFLIVISIHGQKKGWLERKNIDIVKNGPYFGIQKGGLLQLNQAGKGSGKIIS